jgi:hypothetical protein
MGKNRTIQSLGKVIGNIVVHKIILEYGNKPESRSHISSEIIAYGDNALEIAGEFNWNDSDKIMIKQEILKEFHKKMQTKYSDIKFPAAVVDEIVGETLKEFLGSFK